MEDEPVPALPSKQPTYSYEEALAKCIAKDRSVRQNMALGNIPLCPIFEPTLKEFTEISFEDYVKKCEDSLGPEIGCFKVRIKYNQNWSLTN